MAKGNGKFYPMCLTGSPIHGISRPHSKQSCGPKRLCVKFVYTWALALPSNENCCPSHPQALGASCHRSLPWMMPLSGMQAGRHRCRSMAPPARKWTRQYSTVCQRPNTSKTSASSPFPLSQRARAHMRIAYCAVSAVSCIHGCLLVSNQA